MTQKDGWDKTEIVIKLVASIVLVLIPIMISVGADRISQSMERGKLVDSLLAELTDDDKKARRDLALIALDASVPPPERCRYLGLFGCEVDEEARDLVADIAVVLWREYGEANDRAEAVRIIQRRKPRTWATRITAIANVTSDLNSETPLVPGDAERRAQTAAILAEVFAPDTTRRTSQVEALRGVRIVYIHYDAKKDKALEVKETLTAAAVSAPPVRPARGIRKNDIRYPGPQAFEAAKGLGDYLEAELRIKFADNAFIDLSKRGYKVPSGQFEIWLED